MTYEWQAMPLDTWLMQGDDIKTYDLDALTKL